MKRIAAVAIVVLAACAPLGLTVGCAATIGRAYRADSVDQLLPGKTTEDDAIRMLGAKPTHRQTHLIRQPDSPNWKEGDYYLGWVFARGTAWGSSEGRSLILLFSKDKVLKEVVAQSGCSRGHSSVQAAPELAPFVELARKTECADDRRRLFVIDNVLVFFDRAGDCPDNSYSETLFGGSVDEVLCASHNSIAGPVTECHDAAFRELFETIIAHLDEPDLGLGSRHTVHQVPV